MRSSSLVRGVLYRLALFTVVAVAGLGGRPARASKAVYNMSGQWTGTYEVLGVTSDLTASFQGSTTSKTFTGTATANVGGTLEPANAAGKIAPSGKVTIKLTGQGFKGALTGMVDTAAGSMQGKVNGKVGTRKLKGTFILSRALSG